MRRAEELNGKTWIKHYFTEEKRIRVKIQDIILLQSIWYHGKSLLRGENPKSLAFHGNGAGLLCEGLTGYESRFGWFLSSGKADRYAKIREYEGNLKRVVRNKELLLDLDHYKVIKRGYQLDYEGKYYDSDTLKLVNAWFTYVRNTYILWVDDNRETGEIVSWLNDLSRVFSHRISHLKSHRRLHVKLPGLKNDQRLVVDLDYQYIHVMKRIIHGFNEFMAGNHDSSIIPRFYWYKGLFCKGYSPSYILINNNIIDKQLDSIRVQLREFINYNTNEPVLSLNNVKGQNKEVYHLTYNGRKYDDGLRKDMKLFLIQAEGLYKLLDLYRGNPKDIYDRDTFLLLKKTYITDTKEFQNAQCKVPENERVGGYRFESNIQENTYDDKIDRLDKWFDS